MAAMPAALSKKTMGLPRWALGLGVVGAIGVGLYLRSRSAGTKTAASTPTDVTGTGITDTTGLATPPAGGAAGVDMSGLATADQINMLQQTLADLPAEIAIAIGPTTPPDPGPGPQPFIPQPPGVKPKAGTIWKPGIGVVRGKVNKAPGRTPKKKPPKPTPKPVKKATKVVNRLKPKPKPKPKKKPVKRTVHAQNVATQQRIANVVQSSQATHRNAGGAPAFFLTK